MALTIFRHATAGHHTTGSDRTPTSGPRRRPLDILAWALFALLTLLTVASVAKGLGQAWLRRGDFDMGVRVREYESFRRGVYPNRAVAGVAARPGLPYTVYPPYALPMFAWFFEPGGRIQGRILVELMSLASLVVMGVFGWRELRFAGPAMAAVGAIAGAAIMGNSSALGLGQFSILSAGLVVQQMIFLARDRPIAAGVCWSLAMIKPQIALAFAALFLLNRQWRGLLVGIAILAGLGLFACWWTDVSPARLIHHHIFRMPMAFADSESMSGPGHLAGRIGVSPHVAQLGAIALLGAFAVMVCWAMRFVHVTEAARLHVAGVCGVLGQLLCYHRPYDNVMLFPTLIAMLAVAAAAPSRITVGSAVLMSLTVWLPQRLIERVPGQEIIQMLIWSAVAAVLVSAARGQSRLPFRPARSSQ